MRDKSLTVFQGRAAIAMLMANVALLALLPGCQSSDPTTNAALAGRESKSAPNDLPPVEAAWVCFKTAGQLEQNGYSREAIAQYERARELNPKLSGVSHRLAVLYDRECDDVRAKAEYEKALSEQPNDAEVLNDFGYFHCSRQNWPEAEKALRAALAVNPKLSRAWINLGVVLASQHKYADALTAFSTVLTAAEARSNVGVIMAQHGDDVEAEEMLLQALALDSTLVQPRLLLEEIMAHKRAGRRTTPSP